ncbi:hypothetical protein COCON_G00095790 [Conger conger]|uniref:Vitellogenin domain-containing protein n=1 Tax=Conger conger TaxID=82655 RepID=A0A9Q1HZJ7_CONCO|nr:apolipoprotein B-100-like [Conger conger]KAJ8274954.1 hypothetical protein COCON_G00095790 [Conger conger]
MGDTKLCLLLLLCAYAIAQEDTSTTEEQSPTCLLATRFKSFNKYEYEYEAENLNGVNGASDLKNGPKVTCKVEIEVPQTCSYVVHTSECTLSEVTDIDSEGLPVYGPAAGADAFRAAMAKNPLKLTVESESRVSLFPEEDEPINILNIKRGIMSALLVPVLEEEKIKNMVTLHGICKTDFAVNTREDIATDVTVTRDLSHCDGFSPKKDFTSPLALISGLHIPLSKLISSTQTCNYKFDNEKKHMTKGTCTEKHIFLPFSYQGEYGISTLVKQTLTLRDSSNINDRVFDYNEANRKALHMEVVEDKSPAQTKDVILATLRELSTLSQTSQGNRRAHLFQKLVTEIRGLKSEALSPAVPEMVEVSAPLTWQALAQCGTPECSSAILQILRTMDKTAPEVDAAVYAMGLISNPNNQLVQDMLDMAKYKKSKPILYTLSKIVKRFYQAEGKVTPEIIDVAQFMASLLGNECAGDKEQIFLALRVVGNMGKAMEAADPELKSTLLKCMRQPATTLSVQQAAIQAFRQMTVTGEVRTNLQKVFQYGKGAVQKRLAAYLILMKNPEVSDLEIVKKTLKQEQNMQIKNFVASHIYNIVNSKDGETEELRNRIIDVMQEQTISTHFDYKKFSRNYKMDASVSMQDPLKASVQGNMIFDPTGYMPKEIMLETTLKAFGYNLDMLEVGMEGKGFEPTIEALFGENGFFPDTILKAMYWAEDKMPSKVKQVLNNWIVPQGNNRQVPENIMREIARNANKLVNELQSQDSPEATAYLRIMGDELGYMKASDLKSLAQSGAVYAEMLSRMMPAKFLKSLVSSTDNEFFVHYIFMDNEFSLPTSSGLPMKVSVSGTAAPGAKGGVRLSPNMHELSFMPSIGVEFVTKMGVSFPEFVASGIEMHTSIIHESALNAKVNMGGNQIKLSIPAPQDNTQLLGISNKLFSVTAGQTKMVPTMAEGRTDTVKCGPLFTGLQFCTTQHYSDASSTDSAPYFPLTGESEFAVDIQPTGDVYEYTATIAYELLNEGDIDGLQKVDALTMTLKAEGNTPTEAVGTIKYNRNMNMLTTDIQIPDYDVEAGIRFGVSESSSKEKQITFDITNKKIPQLSLVCRAKLEAMADGMLQFQLTIPTLTTDATVTATLQSAEGLTLGLESVIKIPETSSQQKIIFTYDENKVEVKFKSDMSSDIQKLFPYAEDYHKLLQQFIDDILDQKVAKTDMNIRHIFSKSIEAGNIWLDKIADDIPYVENLRGIPGIVLPSVPENLFLKSETMFRYQFNKDRISITLRLPLGGQSSTDLNFPTTVTTPRLSMPKFGLEIPSKEISIPSFSIPPSYELQLPLIGMAEVSTKLNSNFYSWEGKVSGGNNTLDTPSYIAMYQVMADSPLDLLSYRTEGTVLITDTTETLTTLFNASLNHKFVEASFSLKESMTITDRMRAVGTYKVEASSPLGFSSSMYLTTQMSSTDEEIAGDASLDGAIKLGSLSSSTSYTQAYIMNLSQRKATGESTLRVDTPLGAIVNKIKGTYANEELTIDSNTKMENERLKHVTKVEISYKDSKVSLKSDIELNAISTTLRHQVAFTASPESASFRVESLADNSPNRASCLLSGSLNAYSLEINTDASINFKDNQGSHKATVMINSGGLSTSGTTKLQFSPLTFENVFNGGVDGSGATMSLNSKGNVLQHSADLSVDGKIGGSYLNLNSALKGIIFDADSRNTMKFKVDQEGLTFSNNLIGSLREMKTENQIDFGLTFWALAFKSKTENLISDSTSYKHDIAVDLMPFFTSMKVNNDLKILDVHLTNDGLFKLEPYKMDLTGNLKGAFREEQIKHVYEIIYADQEVKVKCITTGQIIGTQIAHNTDLEISGLSSKLKSESTLNSKSLRLNSLFEIAAAPFDLSIDGMLNSDGDVELYGKHTGHLYSKVLLKAEPQSITYTHDCRGSTTHNLDTGASTETSFASKMDGVMNLQEQKAEWEVESKLNKHEYKHKINTYNNLTIIGTELSGTIMTDLLNRPARENQEFAISGFLKYDKNSEGHIINLPFIENIPAIFEQLKTTLVNLKDSSIDWLQDLDVKYKISASIQEKASELKVVIQSFDIMLFTEDLKNFISTMPLQIPTEKIISLVHSLKEILMEGIEELGISGKMKAVHIKLKELLEKYEIEKIVEATMEGASRCIKEYQITEKIDSVIDVLKSIDFEGKFEKAKHELNEVTNQLKAIDFKGMINDFDTFLNRIIRNIESFDYQTFLDDLRQIMKVPAFGKLSGQLGVLSPSYKLTTKAELHNTTTNPVTPQVTACFSSEAKADIDLLAHSLVANVLLAAPKMDRLFINENLKVTHMAFTVEHQSSATLFSKSVSASARTIAKATTEPYTAELTNSASLILENGIFASLDNKYNHNLNMPLVDISSQASATHKSTMKLDSSAISVTSQNTGNGKWSFLDYSDEGTHKSNLEFTIDINTANLNFTSNTDSEFLKMTQSVNAESAMLSYVTVNARAETKTPFIKSSVIVLNGKVLVKDLKMELIASHHTELVGRIEGTLSNTINFLAQPFELVLDCKNKANGKIILPLKLSGKINLLNDYKVALDSEGQEISWVTQARFNQYKYSNRFTMDNKINAIALHIAMGGEANLDVLNIPITIPEMTVPLINMKISSVEEFSLWEDTGLKSLLATTQQSFDLNLKLQYQKNPEMYNIDINMEPVYKAIEVGAMIMNQNFILGRDIAVALVTTSYNQAKEQYDKFQIDTSNSLQRSFTIPGYTVPILNIDVAPFTAELPALSFVMPKEIHTPSYKLPIVGFVVPSYILVLPVIQLPVIHVPETLSQLTLPSLTLPTMRKRIVIPAMGNMTYELSFKSAVFTLNSNAGIYNQNDIVAKFGVTSSSVFEILKSKLEGTSTLTKKRGLKLATTMSLEHTYIQGTHESTIALNRKGMETSMANIGKIMLATETIEFDQKLIGNSKDGISASVSSPSTGFLGFQLQKKTQSQVHGRLFGRYLSVPENDVEILSVKASLKHPGKLHLQTIWNSEVPYEMLLGLKERVPDITSTLNLKDTVSNTIEKVYSEIPRTVNTLQSGIEQIKDQGKIMYQRASESFADTNLQQFSRDLSHYVKSILSQYQNNIKVIMDAIIQFLKETQFQLPGIAEKLTGFEIYQKVSQFVTMVIEDAIREVPKSVALNTNSFIKLVEDTVVTLPGSNHLIIGKDIVDDLKNIMENAQARVITMVWELQAVSLEDMLESLKDFLLYTANIADDFITSLMSPNLDNLSAWVNTIYSDAVNSKVLSDIFIQLKGAGAIAEEKLAFAKTKLQEVYSYMTMEKLNAILQSWIDALVKHLNSLSDEITELLKQISDVQPYMSVSDKKMDIDIPLPFAWNPSKTAPKEDTQ